MTEPHRCRECARSVENGARFNRTPQGFQCKSCWDCVRVKLRAPLGPTKRCYRCQAERSRVCRCGTMPVRDLATGLTRCPGCTEYNPRFFNRSRKQWDYCTQECLDCKRDKASDYRRDPHGRQVIRECCVRRREKLNICKRNYLRTARGRANRARAIIRMARRRPLRHKAASAVANAIRYGHLVRPECCENRSCRYGLGRLQAYFTRDEDPFRDLTFFCAWCHSDARRLAGFAKRFEVQRAEWDDFHQEHRAKIDLERDVFEATRRSHAAEPPERQRRRLFLLDCYYDVAPGERTRLIERKLREEATT